MQVTTKLADATLKKLKKTVGVENLSLSKAVTIQETDTQAAGAEWRRSSAANRFKVGRGSASAIVPTRALTGSSAMERQE